MPITRVAVAGLGAIGRVLARKLSAGVPGLTLACAAAESLRASTRPMAPRPATATRVIGIRGPWV